MKKSTGPIPMITHFGKSGVAIGDCRARGVALRCDRQMDIPMYQCGFWGDLQEVAATKRLTFSQRLRMIGRRLFGIYAWW